jgi:hypothetical protein
LAETAVPLHLEVVAADALGYAARPEIIDLRQSAYGEETRACSMICLSSTLSRA